LSKGKTLGLCPKPSRTLRVLAGRPAAYAAPASPDVPHKPLKRLDPNFGFGRY